LENFFLSAAVIHAALAELCKEVGQPIPQVEDIEATLTKVLAMTGDKALYPSGADRPNRNRVVGSEVLKRLYWKYAVTVYEKVRDGVHLARAAKELDSQSLDPLVQIVQRLGTKPGASSDQA
jgi:hypothetical protein